MIEDKHVQVNASSSTPLIDVLDARLINQGNLSEVPRQTRRNHIRGGSEGLNGRLSSQNAGRFVGNRWK